LSKGTTVAENLKNKEAAVNKLCMKIKTFFKDTCQLCNEAYTTKLNHQPLMHCGSCGQKVHRQCYVNLLKSMNLLDENEQMRHLIFNIPGIYYLCSLCQDETINFPHNKPCNNDEDEENGNSTQIESQSPAAKTNDEEIQSNHTPRRVLPPIPITPNVILNQKSTQESEVHLGRTEFMRNKLHKEIQII